MDGEVVGAASEGVGAGGGGDGFAEFAEGLEDGGEFVDGGLYPGRYCERGCRCACGIIGGRAGGVFRCTESTTTIRLQFRFRNTQARKFICQIPLSNLLAPNSAEKGIEFFAIEGAEFHVSFDYAVEVDFLRFEVVQPMRVSNWLVWGAERCMYRVSPFEGSP